MKDLVKVNSNPEFQAYMTYEEDQEKIFNSRIKAGIKQGLEQGRNEERIKIARALKNDGFDTVRIMEYTSLSKEEIEKL